MAVKADKPTTMDAFDLLTQYIQEEEPKLTPEDLEIQRKLDEQRTALPEAFKRAIAKPLYIPEPDVKPMPLKQRPVQIEESPSSAQRKLEAAAVQIGESESAANRRLIEAQEQFAGITYEESTPSPTS